MEFFSARSFSMPRFVATYCVMSASVAHRSSPSRIPPFCTASDRRSADILNERRGVTLCFLAAGVEDADKDADVEEREEKSSSSPLSSLKSDSSLNMLWFHLVISKISLVSQIFDFFFTLF